MANNFQFPPNIKKLLDDKEKTGSLHFRSEGGDSRGLLVGQYSRWLGGKAGDWGVTEYVDVYLDKAKWELIKREPNRHPKNDLEITFKESSSRSVTNSTETTVSADLGFEKVFKFSMGIEDKRITAVTTSNERGTDKKHTLGPGESAYIYRRIYQLNLRAWWSADLSGAERVVTQDATTNNTHEGAVKSTITGDDEIFFEPLSGEQTITLPKANKERDDSPNGWKNRIRFSDLYNPAKAQVAGAWKRALGGSRDEVIREMLKYKDPSFEFTMVAVPSVEFYFLGLTKLGIAYPPPV
ncbi:unnamed protein product [Rhizoctonia solani]|uniref:Uncharacterized protein n=1 Tax=Rhizoctonia solani TaxID=456999 RepID=A0A8H2XEL0_9AGAM|nr:unnamed protein product [Rhizoctonia solani]